MSDNFFPVYDDAADQKRLKDLLKNPYYAKYIFRDSAGRLYFDSTNEWLDRMELDPAKAKYIFFDKKTFQRKFNFELEELDKKISDKLNDGNIYSLSYNEFFRYQIAFCGKDELNARIAALAFIFKKIFH